MGIKIRLIGLPAMVIVMSFAPVESPFAQDYKAPNKSSIAVSLPKDLTPDMAVKWIQDNKYISVQNDVFEIDRDKFSKLPVKEALQIYKALNRKRSNGGYATIRILFFAGSAEMPERARDIFAKKTGAVFSVSKLAQPARRGDYTALFSLRKTEAYQDLCDRAIARYAPVLSDSEMVRVLKSTGAIKTYLNLQKDERWDMSHLAVALEGLPAEALLAIEGAISKTVLGDRRKVRKRIRTLAESQRHE